MKSVTALPFAGGHRPMATSNAEIILEKTWRPQLAVTAHGRLSPARQWRQCAAALFHRQAFAAPAADLRGAKPRAAALKAALEKDPPYDAEVTFDVPRGENGWNAPSAGALAGSLAEQGEPGRLRQAGGVPGRRRLDPLHGHAGPKISPRPSSSSPACWGRIPTPMAPTNSCTLPLPGNCRPASPSCWPITPADELSGFRARSQTDPRAQILPARHPGGGRGCRPCGQAAAGPGTVLGDRAVVDHAYSLMAVAAWRVWKKAGLLAPAMMLYAVQLALNLVWRFWPAPLLGMAMDLVDAGDADPVRAAELGCRADVPALPGLESVRQPTDERLWRLNWKVNHPA